VSVDDYRVDIHFLSEPQLYHLGALSIAESMRSSIEALSIPHMESVVANHVTISLGVSSMVPQPHSNPDMIIKSADKALYNAKMSSRNTVEKAL